MERGTEKILVTNRVYIDGLSAYADELLDIFYTQWSHSEESHIFLNADSISKHFDQALQKRGHRFIFLIVISCPKCHQQLYMGAINRSVDRWYKPDFVVTIS